MVLAVSCAKMKKLRTLPESNLCTCKTFSLVEGNVCRYVSAKGKDARLRKEWRD